jgi:3-oxo-5-alpha-steroid 4-dehydrogenase 1
MAVDSLTRVDLQTFTTFVYAWGALGIVSALGIHLSRQLPLSSRIESRTLGRLGSIDKKLGWIIMETPVLIAVSWFYLTGRNPLDASVVVVGAFVVHYVHRALIFPHRIKVQGKRMPLATVVASMIFYTINGYMIGYYFGSLRELPFEWLRDPRFLLGAGLFVVGFVVNVKADDTLINLRAPGESGYAIPRGGLFEYVSCPNFLGEIVEWIGFAIMSWSLPGAVYAIWVSSTLFSTGLATHRWYREHFGEDYPRDRKAIVPFVV